MKKLNLVFYQTNPSLKNTGMKIVLFEIETEAGIIHDYGMCDWIGDKWDEVPMLQGHVFRVYCWANWPDPKNLTESKVIIG